jgi:tetratricopeptide (TPR) repeat protein
MRQMTAGFPGSGKPRLTRRNAPLAAAVLCAIVALAFVAGVSLRRLGQSSPASSAAPRAAQHAALSTDQQIATLQQRLTAKPDDTATEIELAAAYLQKIRDTADSAYYPKALATIQDALAREPGNAEALAWMGGLQLSLHDFSAGLEWGTQAHAANPDLLAAYPVLIDAYVELGRYDDAVRVSDQFVGLKPGNPSYSRVSYIRELYGDREGAIEAMQMALGATADGTEAAAWTRVQLGNLYFNSGDLAQAEQSYQRTLTTSANYAPAEAGLARVAAARGDYARAIELLTPLVNRIPLPEYVILLGDVYTAAGQPDAAAQQYALVRVETQLLAANGVNTDLELALFEADHPDAATTPAQVVATARAALATRPSIYGHDALAWALYRAGDFEAAHVEMQQALRLNTQDALLRFHAAAIAQARGDLAQARAEYQLALTLNPNFSLLHAPEARAALARLGE